MDALRRDWRTASLSSRERAILEYCDKISREPTALGKRDIDGLTEEGLGEGEVLGVVMLAGFFQLTTRIADALGVELDPELTRGSPEYERFMQASQT